VRDRRETFWIDQLDAFSEGYNVLPTATTAILPPSVLEKMSKAQTRRFSDKENHPFYGKSLSKEHKAALSAALTGREFSEEHKRNVSQAKLEHYRNNPPNIPCHSDEFRAKISKLQKGAKNNSSKLSLIDVLWIHVLYSEGYYQSKLSDWFCVSQSQISRILSGKKWPHAKAKFESWSEGCDEEV
jgi:ATP-dependent exoDNAse (exonuclease V) alpha subunit